MNKLFFNKKSEADRKSETSSTEKPFSKFAALFFVITIAFATVVLGGCDLIDMKAAKYDEAIELIESKNYAAAYEIFNKLDDYKDSKAYLSRFHYVVTQASVTSEFPDKWNKTILNIKYNDKNLPQRVISTESKSISYSDYTYDINGDVLKEVSTSADGNQTVTEYTYDANRNLIKKVRTEPSGDKYSLEYTYDQSGNMIREISTSYDGIRYTKDYSYDSSGKLIKKTTENDTVDYVYNDKGWLIKEIEAYVNGGQITRDYTYDRSGNMIKKVFTSGNGDTVTTDYVYDSENRQIKETETAEYGVSYVIETFYDENGNRTKFVLTQSNSRQTVEFKQYELVYIPYDLSDEVMGLVYPEP